MIVKEIDLPGPHEPASDFSRRRLLNELLERGDAKGEFNVTEETSTFAIGSIFRSVRAGIRHGDFDRLAKECDPIFVKGAG